MSADFDLTSSPVNYNPDLRRVYHSPTTRPSWKNKVYNLLARFWPKALAFTVNKLWDLLKFIIAFIKDMIRSVIG